MTTLAAGVGQTTGGGSPVLAVILFAVTYILIVVDRWPRAAVSLGAAFGAVLLRLIPQPEAFATVDWNVIFLLLGMMMIADSLRRTGVFEWLAVRALVVARGRPLQTLILLGAITAVGSAALDNVTMIVLTAPTAVIIARRLNILPVPFLVAQVLAANIGGAATLIGDPPNILIGSAADLDFITFLGGMAVPSVLAAVAVLAVIPMLFRQSLRTATVITPDDLRDLAASTVIQDRPGLIRGLIVLGAVIGGFLVHGVLGYEVATIAMTGAAVLLLLGEHEPHQVLREVEWSTLLFFIGLFILVETLAVTGVLKAVGEALVRALGDNTSLLMFGLLWGSAAASGIVDNIPYTATMIPLVKDVIATTGADPHPLWWALALGADLGGNATLIGASANVVAAQIATRSGAPMSFRSFLRYGIPATIISLIVSSIYLWLRYLL